MSELSDAFSAVRQKVTSVCRHASHSRPNQPRNNANEGIIHSSVDHRNQMDFDRRYARMGRQKDPRPPIANRGRD